MACFLRLLGSGGLLMLLLLLSFSARATHIVGGEMDLQYVSGNNYQLTLTLYFDAINGSPGALDNDLTAGIFDKATNGSMQNVVLPLVENTYVAYTNPACTSPSLSTRKLVYRSVVQLSPNVYTGAQGYYVAVERCCRNNGISNIVRPGESGQTFYLEFPAVLRNGQPFRDSTPRIFPPLSDYACLGELFYYDFGGQDPDGDSLVYELATPLNGYSSTRVPKPATATSAPYPTISWGPGRSEQSQIPGAPTLTINRRTGRLEVRPTQLGLFVFGIKCSEYRNKVKIGETRRDFQLKVITCPTNADPTITAQAQLGNATYLPGRDTIRLVPGGNPCVRLRFTDADNASALSLSLQPVNFTGPLPSISLLQGMVRATGMPDTLISQLCFPTCFDTKGQVYYLNVIVADNGCSLPKRDTVQLAILAQPAPTHTPELTSVPTLMQDNNTPLVIRVAPGSVYEANLTATDADNDPLTLTAAGTGFDMAAAGMSFVPTNGKGRATGVFRWEASCSAALLQQMEVTFRVQESTCYPQPQVQVVRFEVVSPDTLAFLPPNIITPGNHDGKNDEFTLPTLPPDFCDNRFANIKIFSRWGNEVYSSADRNFRWDGGGRPAGVYFYLIEYTNKRRFKGMLTLAPAYQ
ncbi:gliding motility-associated C-terminal domain-containing protein [Hymenobacter profundi]|uniref:Gliding motility-associated C-terminal domain-containing protein n=1 Tax=Hymenobacter profundi TaxID=1982110 RepID=A0ABS6WU27_9BACT|nr:gliding motility-associated C-terminal domain-containing protein [Hymenobacter profundi]MBW3126928.1 gliding motility-associated C-terminal domain-containing protein [Hymenobacter profundi]MBW3127081.1 gliding motility-associated C-terminal domain-containing protein [Hymenobacter profundi]